MEAVTKFKISYKYNLILATIWLLEELIVGILDYKDSDAVTIYDMLFEKAEVLTTIGSILGIMGFIFIGIWVVRSFWERFVSQVFDVRPISRQEALSILLVVAIVA